MTHPMTFLKRLYNERLVVTSLFLKETTKLITIILLESLMSTILMWNIEKESLIILYGIRIDDIRGNLATC